MSGRQIDDCITVKAPGTEGSCSAVNEGHMTAKAARRRAWSLGGWCRFSLVGGAVSDWSESIFAVYQLRPPAVRARSALAAGFLFARR